MNGECEFVLDLLPLYAEGIASESTCRLVEEHIADCEECRSALDKMKQSMPIPMQTDPEALAAINRQIKKKKRLQVLTGVLLTVTLLFSLWILHTVPVWLTAAEAIDKVELVDGELRVHYSDRLNRPYMYNGNLFGAHIRLVLPRNDSWSTNKKPPLPLKEQTLYYLGVLVGEEDTLLWQADTLVDTNMPKLEADWTIAYVFWSSLALGVLTVVGAVVMRKKKTGKLLMCVGLLFMCCAASCWFVTGGRFAMVALEWRVPGHPGNLHYIGILSILVWTTVLSVRSLVGRMIREKRRVSNEAEL